MEDNDDGEQEWMQTGGVIRITEKEDKEKIFNETGITDEKNLQTRILDTETRTDAINELNNTQFKKLRENLENLKNLEDNKKDENIKFLLKSLQPRIKQNIKDLALAQAKAKAPVPAQAKPVKKPVAEAVKPATADQATSTEPETSIPAPAPAPVAAASQAASQAPVAAQETSVPVEKPATEPVAELAQVAEQAPVAEPEYQIVQIKIQPKHDLLQETIALLTDQTFAKTYTAVLDQPTQLGKYQGQIDKESLILATKLKAYKYYLYNGGESYYLPPDLPEPVT